jgi:GNAT superfamily N-acetyltransferase
MVKLVRCDSPDSDADAHWQALSGDAVAASCSLWWSNPPGLPGERPGLIGQYSAQAAEASRALIDHACQELADHGCTVAIGPMDGSTWKKYRFLTRRGTLPPFLLEPDNPDEYPAYFVDAGFEVLATYTSAITNGLDFEDERAERAEARLRREQFRIRQIDLANFERELHLLYEISIAAFSNNFLYKPIAQEDFCKLYRPVRPLIRPELVLIAERDGDPAAFLFGLPDHNPENFIIKTLAAHPRYAGRGLGTLLIQHANRAAAALGYRRAIHALMHQDNQSTRISARQAEVFRQYTLYSKRLTSSAAT